MFDSLASQTRTTAPTVKKLGLLFIMFILQNVSLGFTWTLIPILMRQQGLSLGAIGLTALIYSPWALKFLWASRVDLHYSPRMGRRKSWIAPLSILTVCILPLLALLDPEASLLVVLGLVFLLNLNIATTDIAVDGYATDILAPDERAWGNTIQIVGYLIGHMLGSGAFLIIYQYLGWRDTLLIMTAVHVALNLPVVLHREITPIEEVKAEAVEPGFRPSARAFLKLARVRWLMLFLLLAGLTDNGGNQLRLALLADCGLDPQRLGELNLWIGSPLSILGSLAGGFLLKKWDFLKVFVLGCLGAVFLSWFSAFTPAGVMDIRWSAGIMLGTEKLMGGMMMVLIYSMIMGMSVGPQAATNYAVLCSFNHVVSLGALPVAGLICDVSGYSFFYAGLGALGLLTLLAGGHIINRRLRLEQSACVS